MKYIKWDDPDIGDEEIEAATLSLTKTIGVKGENISLAEEEFAAYLDVKHCILVSSGTAALVAACDAVKNHYKLKSISVPAFSFIASASAAQFVFDKVDLLDVNRSTYNVEVLGHQDALMTVDVAGHSCDYDSLMQLPVIADSAESMGSTYKDKLIGSQADIHCFSFQRSKIITCGEGGLVTTNNDDLAARVRAFINHGYSEKRKSHEYIHDSHGLNFRMNDVEAAILRVQLRKIDKYIKHRQRIGEMYDDAFWDKFEIQQHKRYSESNRFMYVLQVDSSDRDRFVEHLMNNNGIQVKTWRSINQQPMWKKKMLHADFISDTNVLIPIHNRLSISDAEYIIEKCLEFE